MLVARRAIYMVIVITLGLMALSLAFGGGAQLRSSDLTSTLQEAAANNEQAQGAPQQQVVNGWAARDLLALQIDRSDELIAQQQRTNGLLAILIITVAVMPLVLRDGGATRGSKAKTTPATSTEPPAGAAPSSGPLEQTLPRSTEPSGATGAVPWAGPIPDEIASRGFGSVVVDDPDLGQIQKSKNWPYFAVGAVSVLLIVTIVMAALNLAL